MALLPNCIPYKDKTYSCETCGYYDPKCQHPKTPDGGFCSWGFLERPTTEDLNNPEFIIHNGVTTEERKLYHLKTRNKHDKR